MKIHKEGYRLLYIWFSGMIAIIILTLSLINTIKWVHICFFIPLVALSFFFLYFFRSPKRKIKQNENYLLSPADGKVINIETVTPFNEKYEAMTLVSIFMSVWNVHLNRFPVSGKVISQNYYPGKYLVAWHPKSSEQNEHTKIIIETETGDQILVRQIAGAVARRIKTYAEKGMLVRQGEELGFIRFGSRVDLIFPKSYKVKIEKNTIVKGGKTVIAKK